MKEDARPAVKHEFEHAAPTVIHDPEQDMTILARWLHRGMERGPKFWYLLVGSVVALIVVTVLANGLSRGKSSVGKAWTELNAAQTPGQKVEVADSYPDTEVAMVARLSAATEFFQLASRDLPAQRESAVPQLKRALDLFLQVAKEAPRDSSVAVTAAFGAARTYEARNELPEAIEQYQAVVSGWPDSPEAKQSAALIARLKDPEVVAFYKELYTYKPPVASPTGSLPDFGSPSGIPGLSGPSSPGGPLSIPGFPTLPGPARPSTSPPPTGPGPGPIDLPPPPLSAPPATKPDASKLEPAKPAAKPEPPGDLPGDVFKPAAPKS